MKEITTRQMAMIKRIAMNVNPLVVKKNKLLAKIEELNTEIAEIEDTIYGNEIGIKNITGGLSSEILITKTVTDSGKVDKNGNPIKVTKYEPNPNRLQWNEEKKVYNLIPLSEEEPIVEDELENTEVSETTDENNEL